MNRFLRPLRVLRHLVAASLLLPFALHAAPGVAESLAAATPHAAVASGARGAADAASDAKHRPTASLAALGLAALVALAFIGRRRRPH